MTESRNVSVRSGIIDAKISLIVMKDEYDKLNEYSSEFEGHRVVNMNDLAKAGSLKDCQITNTILRVIIGDELLSMDVGEYNIILELGRLLPKTLEMFHIMLTVGVRR